MWNTPRRRDIVHHELRRKHTINRTTPRDHQLFVHNLFCWKSLQFFQSSSALLTKRVHNKATANPHKFDQIYITTIVFPLRFWIFIMWKYRCIWIYKCRAIVAGVASFSMPHRTPLMLLKNVIINQYLHGIAHRECARSSLGKHDPCLIYH